ncbi:hypothetical protein BGZ47_011722 [Haplosporangium gracile]|nr:hypothetical protein BGZ47_011722 [Haplosporangium gracile]
MHCVVPQLVARSGASAVRQRTMATLSSSTSTKTSTAVKGAAGKALGSTTAATAKAAKAATPPPASANAAAEENPLWELWKAHKHNKLAIGTVLVAALMGDAAVSWVLFGKKKKEGEEGQEAAQAESVANTSVAATVA